MDNFRPNLLTNYQGLERYVNAQEALLRIKKRAGQDLYPSAPVHYFNRWQVVQITTKYVSNYIASCYFIGIAYLLQALNLERIARPFTLLSMHMLRDWEQLNDQWCMGKTLIMPAYNKHKLGSWDTYLRGNFTLTQPSEKVKALSVQREVLLDGLQKGLKLFFAKIEKNRKSHLVKRVLRRHYISSKERSQVYKEFVARYIEDPQNALNYLKEIYPNDQLDRPLQKLYDKITETKAIVEQHPDHPLFYPQGLCHGASLWFITLFLKSRGPFNQKIKHLQAVAQEFLCGVPGQGALLQMLPLSSDLLGLVKTPFKYSYVSTYELDYDRASAKDKIEKLLPGVYRVGVYGHSLVYVKTGDEEYVWDPDYGLYEMNGQELLDMILNRHYKRGDRDSHIYFDRYDLSHR